MINSKIYKSILVIISVIFICSVIFHLAEYSYNEKINSFKDSLWWGFVTSTTVGYGDIYPVTSVGRVTAIFLMLTAIGTFGFITATLASVLHEKNLKKGMGLLDVNFKNHIVIVGWNYRSKSIIEELLNEDENIRVVLIDSNVEQNPYDNNKIFYIKGDATDDKVLDRANIKSAKTAIVLADKKLEYTEMIDAKSVLICLAINKTNPGIFLVAEVINHKNEIHFRRAGVNDIIMSNQIESKVMVRSILYKGIHEVIKELMTNSYGNEIYQSQISSKYIGKSYERALKDLFNINVTLIGLLRDKKVYINPKGDILLKDKDELIYIAPKKIKL